MKKILSILAAVGLTATASTAVVSCSTKVNAKKETIKGNSTDGYTISWTENFRFNQYTKFVEHHVDNDPTKPVDGFYFMPYKLHVVADTRSNTQPDAKPTDLFTPWANPDENTEPAVTTAGKTLAEQNKVPYVTYYTTYTHWSTHSNMVFWTDKTHKQSGWEDPTTHKHYNIDGIVARDIRDVPTTVTLHIPAGSPMCEAGKTIKALIVREEPNIASKGDDAGKYMYTDSNISITLPADPTK